jgi:hypothetical protein
MKLGTLQHSFLLGVEGEAPNIATALIEEESLVNFMHVQLKSRCQSIPLNEVATVGWISEFFSSNPQHPAIDSLIGSYM